MQIEIKDMTFNAHHGVLEDEKINGREYRVSLSVSLGVPEGASSDALEETIDYRDLASLVKQTSTELRCNLLERVATRILGNVFDSYPEIEEATIEVYKHAPEVTGNPDWVGVQLTRHANQ